MMILVATNLPNAARAFGEDDHLQAEVCKMADRCALVTVFLSLVLSNLYILLHIMIPSSSHTYTSLIGCPNEEGEIAGADR